MNVLGWLLVPLAVTCLAAIWAAWRSRPPAPRSAKEAAQSYAQFSAAVRRPRPEGARTVVHQPSPRSHAVAVRRSTATEPAAPYGPRREARHGR